MRSGPMKRLAVALMMLPGISWADYLADRIGQAEGATSLLLQPPVAFLSREPVTVIFPGPHGTARLGVSMSYTDADTLNDHYHPAPSPPDRNRHISATAGGEVAVSERIGVFGKFGLRYSTNDVFSPAQSEGAGSVQQLDHRYGIGMSVRASEVLSLHFEWERYVQGGAAGADLSQSYWDPWKEKSVFGAGLRFGL